MAHSNEPTYYLTAGAFFFDNSWWFIPILSIMTYNGRRVGEEAYCHGCLRKE